MKNRKIKFQAWNVEEKIMHTVAFPSWNGSIAVWKNNIPQSEIQYLSMNGPEKQGILRQFTGQRDKNGKEVFEGDYIEGVWNKTRVKGMVEFKEGMFGIVDKDAYSLNRLVFKVIGNVFENKNLLKEIK